MTTPEAPSGGTKSATAFLTKKVGPLPVWVWMAAAIGVYLWYSHQQAASTASASAVPNQQTDPAGNIGTIDPATGYVYGTPEDLAALAANNSGSTGSGSAGQNATTGGQTYADNNSWGIAAVNYLVGLGIDATTANQAIQQYLASQTLTSAQQGDVNLAIQALGPPPTLPGPTTGNPSPITGGGGGSGSGGGGGSTTVRVPNLVGDDVVNASSACQSAGLKLSPEVPAVAGETHVVTGQTPTAGSTAATGSTVKITYKTTGKATGTTGKTAAKVRVPSVVGKDVTTASAALGAAGLKMTPEVPAVKGKTHTVTSQTPAANSMVPTGATVTIKYKTTG